MSDTDTSEEIQNQKGCEEYIISEEDFKVEKPLGNDRFRQVDLIKKKKKEDEPEDTGNYVRIQLNSTNVHCFGKQVDVFVHTGTHPSIVQFEGFGYYPHHFAITNYYPNHSLQHILQKDPTKLTGTVKSILVYGLVAAVTHIHNTFDDEDDDFSIRYLCPENIIFDDQFEPRLINYVFRNEELGVTPNAYIPPELHENPKGKRYDEDVWAIGMILYEILTGHKPYQGKSEDQIKTEILSGKLPDFPPPSPETDNIIGIIQNCLDIKPTNRPLPYMILHHLTNLSDKLFPDTDLTLYNNYREKVHPLTIQSQEAIDYITNYADIVEVDPNDLIIPAEKGDVNALVRVGRMYQKGTGGLEKDEVKAFEYYQKAANAGYNIAMYNVAHCLYTGRGCDKDLNEAFKYMKQAAESNLECAVSDYGCWVRDGIGTKPDLKKAIQIFQDAADNHNNKCCQFLIGEMYYDGNKEIKKDVNKAITYYRKSAQNGYAPASCDIAYHYYMIGERDPAKMKKAIDLFKKAGRQNSASALVNLGKIYKEGKYVEKDLEYAAQSFKKAAKLKDVTGMIEYGVCLKNGIGIKKDVKAASSYYHDAAQTGDKRAQHNYAKLLYDGDPPGLKKDVLNAARFFKLAADQGVPPSMFYYAKIVINGEGGVVKNPAEGKAYLNKYKDITPPERRIAGFDELMNKVKGK